MHVQDDPWAFCALAKKGPPVLRIDVIGIIGVIGRC